VGEGEKRGGGERECERERMKRKKQYFRIKSECTCGIERIVGETLAVCEMRGFTERC